MSWSQQPNLKVLNSGSDASVVNAIARNFLLVCAAAAQQADCNDTAACTSPDGMSFFSLKEGAHCKFV